MKRLNWKIRDWGKFEDSELFDTILKEWTELIEAPKTREIDCLKFLKNHAKLFFLNKDTSPIVISELSLGDDYRIDFVIVTDNFSSGTKYTLIEVESPNSLMCTKSGKTSARLTGALDQIAEWRRWINHHRSHAKRIFPSSMWDFGTEPMFDYKVIIDRRGNSSRHLDVRYSKFHDNRVEIMSFDRLTSFLKMQYFRKCFSYNLASQSKIFADNKQLLNRAACPFHTSVGGGDWKKLLKSSNGDFSYHTMDAFLKHWASRCPINEKRLSQYDDFIANGV